MEEVLAFGWIDSLPRKLDETRSMLLISPCTPGSGWSTANKARVMRLEAEGRLAPPDCAGVEAAKADSSWSLLDAVEALEVPPDLAAALKALPPATANFDAFPRSVKRGLLERVVQAKRPETRAGRIAQVAEAAQRNERAAQPRPRSTPTR